MVINYLALKQGIMNMKSLSIVTALLLGVSNAAGQTQASGGLQATDPGALGLLTYVTMLATDSSFSSDRSRFGISGVTASSVELVVDPVTCATAAAKFGEAVGSIQDRNVYLVRMGDWYVVEDPDHTVGEYTAHLIFTSDWELVAALAG